MCSQSPSKPPLPLSLFSYTLSLLASQFHLKDHFLNSDSSCDFQVSTFWPRVGVLTLSGSGRAGLPFSLNEFIPQVWHAHRLQIYINDIQDINYTALLLWHHKLELEKKCWRWIITWKHCKIHLLNWINFRLYIMCTIIHLHLVPLEKTSHKSTPQHI